MAVYGVFDGHGGKQAANYASRNLADKLLSAICQASKSEFEEADCTAREELRGCSKLDGGDWGVWEGQDQVIEALPAALTQAFERLQTDFFEQCKVCCSHQSTVAFGGGIMHRDWNGAFREAVGVCVGGGGGGDSFRCVAASTYCEPAELPTSMIWSDSSAQREQFLVIVHLFREKAKFTGQTGSDF